ncbi:MAG: T9SS type A sorting domain-containing protein [Bacteroidales bacterium]|nr:T9SS type A sorting domain-containing protein [Bacteroidales bacterium]MCF8345227.1 T9SS type A sorting domain-containing protein [Bacteroidales bacterium]MCF8350435.1 T9SS type A sorting domain-containing protein [Bacteroidales bacterium]MCF8377686.1 T9SS type A sorting domain-containing protein [Bacteroidales bacterium]MCF8401962.1 T9SS type A sorting domain-containing protein [Bacteroidales bacterium]
MKKSIPFLLIMLFSAFRLSAQQSESPDYLAFDSLDVNNVIAGVHSSGVLFCHLQGENADYDYSSKFEYPAGSGKNTIFINNLWIGGLDSDDSLHLAGERYRQVGADFQPGPVSNTYDSIFYLKWNRLWRINREEIEYHKLNWDKNGYEPIEAIVSWPGNGNMELGQADQLAPFLDFDNDDMYDPTKGDYPLIRGDQTIFFIYNDDMLHTETEGKSLGVELHCMVYGFDSPNNPELDNSVFVHYDIINRSDNVYSSSYIGIFTDLDIGYAWDDYVGCNVGLGSFFGYNGVEIDGNGEVEAYGENPPVQSITFLAGPFMNPNQEDDPVGGCDFSINGLNFGNGIMDDERYGLTRFVTFDNSGGVTGSPSVAPEYYNYMRGLWKDNSKVLYGGNGHITSGAVGPECRFMFPGDSDPCNWGTNGVPPNGGFNQDSLFWTEEAVNNLPGDRRGLGVTGPITFSPNEIQELELAYTVGENTGTVNAAIENLNEALDELFAMVEDGELIVPNSSLGLNENLSRETSLDLFPVPASNFLSIGLPDANEEIYIFEIHNILGNIMISGETKMDGISKLDISSIRPGIYTLVVFNEDSFWSKKFIKTD